MPKKEEILEKNDKLNKEKISEQQPKKSKTKNTTETKKTTSSKTTKKESAKSTTKKKTNTTKSSSKQTVTKTVAKKDSKNKLETPKKDAIQTKTTKKIEVVEEKKIDELSVIEKIKSFIAKIAAMQEEARKEAQAEKEKNDEKTELKNVKIAKKSKSKEEKETKKLEYMLEYYDLPYRYNETVVKILAQTPKRMFVYWDISDGDREKYINAFGNDFFEKTYPVLLLYNEDKKYIKEIPINDFANSWYIDIPDAKTKYSIQLGRKFKNHNEIVNIDMQKVQENNIILHTDYLPFANSNILEAPNDHVLLETLPRFITFRNVKTNEETVKELKDLKNVYGNSYDVNEFYEEHYKDEISEGMFDMANPSSKLSSSSFK